MSKLLQFKEWLTIEEASNYLTKIFDELIKPQDLYRLAIENKLILSLFLVNNTYIEIANTNNNALLFNSNYQLIQAGSYCDLINIDNSTLILKQHYYNNSVIPLKPNDNNGIILRLDNFNYGRLINYTENNRQLSQVTITHSLPKDIYLVVRTDYLLSFVKQATQPEEKTDLHPKEKKSLYQLIAILATVAKLPINQNYKTADLIMDEIAPKLGISPPSRGTLTKYLKEASFYLSDNNQHVKDQKVN